MKLTFPRESYVPKDQKVRVRPIEDIPAVVITYETAGGKPIGLAFRGRAQKPAFHHSYRSPEHRAEHIARWIEGQREWVAGRAQHRAERNKPHSLHVGQVLVNSWGYDQTNIDWFEVTKVVGKHTVEIRPIAATAVGEQGGPAEGVAPAVGKYTGPAMRKRASSNNSVKIHSWGSWAYAWDGSPRSQTGYGWGH